MGKLRIKQKWPSFFQVKTQFYKKLLYFFDIFIDSMQCKSLTQSHRKLVTHRLMTQEQMIGINKR